MFQSILDDKKFLNSIVLQNEKSKLYYRKRSITKWCGQKPEGKKVFYDAFFHLHFITDIVSVIAFS